MNPISVSSIATVFSACLLSISFFTKSNYIPIFRPILFVCLFAFNNLHFLFLHRLFFFIYLLLSCLFLFCYFSGNIARSLIEMGEAMKELSEVKYALEDNVKQNFLEPLTHLQAKDLKDVMVCFCL